MRRAVVDPPARDLTVASVLIVNRPCSLLTQESEPSDLVGQPMPKSDQLFAWCDGPITRALRDNGAPNTVLLDEIGAVDPKVSERLNPVLESPPVWVVSENGESAALDVPADFRVICTMESTGHTQATPALVNRLTELVLEPLAAGSGRDEFAELAHVIFPDAFRAHRGPAANACRALWRAAHAPSPGAELQT